MVPTMHHLREVLESQPLLKSLLPHLEALKNQGNPDARECHDHFLNAYLRQPPEQLGGVISTIYNYLNYFTNPDIVEVFGPEENTFDFSALTRAPSSVSRCPRNIKPKADTSPRFKAAVLYPCPSPLRPATTRSATSPARQPSDLLAG